MSEHQQLYKHRCATKYPFQCSELVYTDSPHQVCDICLRNDELDRIEDANRHWYDVDKPSPY